MEPTTKIDTNNWSGVLTIENLEAVAQAVEEKLTGMAYTFISRNRLFPDDYLEVRKHQELQPHSRDDKAVKSYTSKHEGLPPSGGFHVSDSYGSWGAYTYCNAHLTFNEMGIFINQDAPAGHRLHWIILLEGKQQEDVDE